MDNYPPMPPIPVVLGGTTGLWCPRKLCQRSGECYYPHNCKALTPDARAAKQAQWEADKIHREVIAAQEARDEQRLRDNRNGRIGVMLAAYYLLLEDLEAWVRDVQDGR
jgi:hypothetical protein